MRFDVCFHVFPMGSPAATLDPNHRGTHTAGDLQQRPLHRARADLKGLASHHNGRGVDVHFAHGAAAIWAAFFRGREKSL